MDRRKVRRGGLHKNVMGSQPSQVPMPSAASAAGTQRSTEHKGKPGNPLEDLSQISSVSVANPTRLAGTQSSTGSTRKGKPKNPLEDLSQISSASVANPTRLAGTQSSTGSTRKGKPKNPLEDLSQMSSVSIASSTDATRKRKSPNPLDELSSLNDEDLGIPVAESTRIMKRKRSEGETSISSLGSSRAPNQSVRAEKSTTRKSDSSSRFEVSSNEISDFSNLSDRMPRPRTPKTAKTKEKRMRNEVRNSNGEHTKLLSFLCVAGITMEDDGSQMLQKEVIVVQQKMSQLLKSGEFKKAEIIAEFKDYIENEDNLKNALNNLERPAGTTNVNALTNLSLIRVLLQVPELCPEIHVNLLNKLNVSVLLADSMDSIDWAGLLLQQFRFLDVVTDKDAYIDTIEQLLESSPPWFLKEIILCLPDIVADKHHQVIAQILNKVWEENPDLTNVVLSCTSCLNLTSEYLDEHRNKALDYLKKTVKLDAIPKIVQFVLEECTNVDIFKKTFLALRSADIQPVPNENAEECFKSQLHIIRTLKMNMFLSKDMVNTSLAVVKDIDKDPKPLDLILLLLVFPISTPKAKLVDNLLKQRIKSGFYRASLLSLLYNNYKLVVQELHPTVLDISSKLLQSNERVFIDFAINWFRLQFQSYDKTIFKQRQILQKIIFLMGNNEKNAKNALTLLCRMVAKDEDKQYLGPHCNELRVLLEKVDNFDLEEVGMLNDLLHSLCVNSSSVSQALQDDLFILMQKQLCAFKPIIKCKGVLAAVMALKHLMTNEDTIGKATELFESAQHNVRNCTRSKALFYDELTKVIVETKSVNQKFLEMITNYLKDEFMEKHMTEKENHGDEDFLPRFGLNNEAQDSEENDVLSFGDDNYGAIIPISFKLLQVCCVRLNKGDLSVTTPLLSSSILMPSDLDTPEPRVLNAIIYCINWFREVINGFIEQTDPSVIKQVLQRLTDLITLQNEFASSVAFAADEYQPPVCYFHVISTPPFAKADRKSGKKGKKDKKQTKDLSKSSDDGQERATLRYNTPLYSKNPLYFRKFEPKIAQLLNVRLDQHDSTSSTYSISMPQVCFIAHELLVLLKNNINETFIRDLIQSLPVICKKLEDIVSDLREDRNKAENKEGTCLLLQLLTEVFSWKGFESVTYNTLLRDGLRTLAAQMNESAGVLRSCKELVAESYKYFESLADIVTDISLAVALINICNTLMKHSESFLTQNKDRHAKMAFSFLCLDWQEDNHLSAEYKKAVTVLLDNWIDNEPEPLKVVTTTLEWLPDEAAKLEKAQDSIDRISTITKNNFPILYRKMFDGLIKGVKIALPLAETDLERIAIWHKAALDVQKLTQISKSLPMKSNVLMFLKNTPILLRIFLNHGMSVLEHNLKNQTEDVTAIVKLMQGGTRYLHTICCDATEKKDSKVIKYVPAAKSVLEQMIYRVKGMLVLNNSPAAFWMGNLVNKNLEGQKILSQNSSEESSMYSELPTSEGTNVSSEIIDSDPNESNDSLIESDGDS